MKKIYVWMGLLALLFAACQENELDRYEGEGAVYFQASASSWISEADSIVCSFAGKEEDAMTVKLLVNLLGNPVEKDRKVKIEIDKELTTAKEGVHYAPLAVEYTLPAGSMQMEIPVEVYNKDVKLEEEAVQLAVRLLPSDDLQLGIAKRTSLRLLISNIMLKPYYWEDFYLDYDFGTYSKVKHEIFIRILGVDFPADADEFDEQYDLWAQRGIYMDTYFTDNYPIYDENGMVIEPWF